MIEEMGEQISAMDLVPIYRSATQLLQRTQDPTVGKRLIASARTIIRALQDSRSKNQEAPQGSWEGFSFKEKVVECERALIERALRDANGSVTRAARLLGFKHHQSLISLINSRHQELLKTRTAVRKRRRHIFSQPRIIKSKAVPTEAQVSILHAKDNEQLSHLINDLFSVEAWRIDLCKDGGLALAKLTGNGRVDLLLVDNELSGLSGLELVKRTRKLTHRRRTPIVMLSDNDCETEAWRAGVDAFFKTPDQMSELSAIIYRLLKIEARLNV
jgi:DNA-binding NtrC family response regulator